MACQSPHLPGTFPQPKTKDLRLASPLATAKRGVQGEKILPLGTFSPLAGAATDGWGERSRKCSEPRDA